MNDETKLFFSCNFFLLFNTEKREGYNVWPNYTIFLCVIFSSFKYLSENKRGKMYECTRSSMEIPYFQPLLTSPEPLATEIPYLLPTFAH